MEGAGETGTIKGGWISSLAEPYGLDALVISADGPIPHSHQPPISILIALHPPTSAAIPTNSNTPTTDNKPADAQYFNYFHRTTLAAKKFRTLYKSSRIFIVAPPLPAEVDIRGEVAEVQKAAFGVANEAGIEVVSVEDVPNALMGETDDKSTTNALGDFNGSLEQPKLEPLKKKDVLKELAFQEENMVENM
ncbi:hypothetical protein HK097_003258 [Rhizophlyctis rosea]|uniref:Uncharacterized protein n=1 Tax=Rhizophlyctis rosea TaxID=64517 RepID=A0AAD5SIB6_9FUNG|nr:hypothetical protein HK097_003258 [Rhizophlyctis rosea]